MLNVVLFYQKYFTPFSFQGHPFSGYFGASFFVGLLMRAPVVGLPVCVNGFRKFMQLPLSKQDKQPTPLSQRSAHSPAQLSIPKLHLLCRATLPSTASYKQRNYQYPSSTCYVEQPYLVQHHTSSVTINTRASSTCYVEQPPGTSRVQPSIPRVHHPSPACYIEQPYNASSSTYSVIQSYWPSTCPCASEAVHCPAKYNPYTGNNQYRCNAAFSIQCPNRSKSMPLRRFTLYLESVNNVDV